MTTITFNQAADAGACGESVRKMARHLGGIEAYGRDTPIPLETVLDVLGLTDALWALFVADEVRWRHLACDYATRVLHVFEERFPDDARPRDAIVFYRANPERPADAAGAAVAAWAALAAVAAEAAVAAGAAVAAEAAGAADAAEAALAALAALAAVAAVAAEAAESEWQSDRYRRYVTGRRPRPLTMPPRPGGAA